MRRLTRHLGSVAWPSFLVAGVLEIAVFAFVDPRVLHTVGGDALQWSATAVYSLAFFVFWAVAAVGCTLTVVLTQSAQEINAMPGSGR